MSKRQASSESLRKPFSSDKYKEESKPGDKEEKQDKCFLAYYDFDNYQIDNRKSKKQQYLKTRIIAKIIELKGDKLFNKIQQNKKFQGKFLTVYPHIGLTETLEQYGKYLKSKKQGYRFINFNGRSNAGREDWNKLKTLITVNEKITDESKYEECIEQFIFKELKLKKRGRVCLLIDNFEKGILQLYKEEKVTSKRLAFILDCWTRTVNSINTTFDNKKYIILGLFRNESKNKDATNLYDEWKKIYGAFSVCFFDVVSQYFEDFKIKNKITMDSMECHRCAGISGTDCFWCIHNLNEVNSKANETQIKNIVRCSDYNPYWILSPLSHIAADGIGESDLDKYVKEFYKKGGNNILYDNLQQLPFYMEENLKYADVEAIKKITIGWFNNLAQKYKTQIDFYLNKIFESTEALNYSERLNVSKENKWLGIDVNGDLSELKQNIQISLGGKYPNINIDSIITAIINVLDDNRAVKIEDNKLISLHPFIAYVHSDLKIYKRK